MSPRSPIFRLVVFWNPFAVGWRVITINIDAFYRISRRAFAKIGKEVCKFVPTFADYNATAAIIFVALFIGIAAATEHALPSDVSTTWIHSFIVSVTVIVVTIIFVTTAGFDCTIAKTRCRRDLSFSTVTSTKPQNATVIAAVATDCDQSPKALIGDIKWRDHRTSSMVRVQVAVGCGASGRCDYSTLLRAPT